SFPSLLPRRRREGLPAELSKDEGATGRPGDRATRQGQRRSLPLSVPPSPRRPVAPSPRRPLRCEGPRPAPGPELREDSRRAATAASAWAQGPAQTDPEPRWCSSLSVSCLRFGIASRKESTGVSLLCLSPRRWVYTAARIVGVKKKSLLLRCRVYTGGGRSN